MKNYRRSYSRFSLCGLNCGLCPMYHISEAEHCPGCGGEGRPACAVIRCSLEHGGVEYCCLCPAYPCGRYPADRPEDSFVPYRNVRRDFERLREWGPERYAALLDEKVELLRRLLRGYNDGRSKSFFCLAVNLLELEEVRSAVARIEAEVPADAPPKEKAAQAKGLLRQVADRRGVVLKLDRKKRG